MWIDRRNAKLCWTWNQYKQEALRFAKACQQLQVRERASVAIMGVNSPEWAIAFIGGILNNNLSTGIYKTNSPDACLYQVQHSEAELVVVESNADLKRFTVKLDQYDSVRAFVVWDENQLPEDIMKSGDSRFYLWKDFMQLGQQAGDIRDK